MVAKGIVARKLANSRSSRQGYGASKLINWQAHRSCQRRRHGARNVARLLIEAVRLNDSLPQGRAMSMSSVTEKRDDANMNSPNRFFSLPLPRGHQMEDNLHLSK